MRPVPAAVGSLHGPHRVQRVTRDVAVLAGGLRIIEREAGADHDRPESACFRGAFFCHRTLG